MKKIKLLKSFIRTNWQQETAYFSNKLLAAFTPLMYVLSFLLFVTVLYQNIDTVAGYTKDEMLFLVFIGQLSYYAYSFWGGGSSASMEQYVNTGALDYVLTKPVSSMYYITFHRILPLHAIINFVGPLTPSWLVIQWSNLNLYLDKLPYAIVIFLCGVALFHYSQFLFSLVSFWTGKGRQSALVVYAASSQSIPLEGFNTSSRRFFLGIIPVYTSSVVASVLLGKSDAVFWLIVMMTVCMIFFTAKRVLWSKALKQYSSASS